MAVLKDAPPVGPWLPTWKEVFRPRPEPSTEVLRRQIRIMQGFEPLGLLVNASVTALLGWLFLTPDTQAYEMLWVLATILLSAARYLDGLLYRDPSPDPTVLARVRRHLKLGAAAQGLLWGVASTLLFPASPLQQMALLAAIAGMTAGALIVLSPIWSIYALYTVPALVPLCVRLLGGDLPILRTMGALGLVYSATLLFIAARTNRWLEEALQAAEENEALNRNLRAANEALVEYHARLEAAVAARTLELHAAHTKLQMEYAAKEEERARTEEREEALRQGQRMESLGLLAGGIAHDFNNLLGAILGNVELVQLQTPGDAPGRTCLDNIAKAVQRAADLTRQMLAYSGKGQFSVRDLDLNQLVRELASLLEVCISKRAALRLNLGQDLAAIHGDPAQLQQVVMNLVINASEALAGEDGEIHITTRPVALDEAAAARASRHVPAQAGPHVLLEVRDTGSGMDPAVLARIFDPFFSTKATGRGLGLSAMLGILKGHGAGIEILSRPSAGSTFRLYFPASAWGEARDERSALDLPSTFRGRVLVADDEPVLLETTQAMLERLGLQVATAVNGVQAMEYMASHGADVDLVLLDLTMPLMDGRQTFRALRRLRPGLPVIFASGNDPRRTPRAGGPHECRCFLHKPYTLDELRRAVAVALEPPAG